VERNLNRIPIPTLTFELKRKRLYTEGNWPRSWFKFSHPSLAISIQDGDTPTKHTIHGFVIKNTVAKDMDAVRKCSRKAIILNHRDMKFSVLIHNFPPIFIP
jgi:hypothetical protein